MRKNSTMAIRRKQIFKQPKLTVVWIWETDPAITAFWMRRVT